MSDLRKALLADHAFRYDIGAEQRADRAVAIVAAWLRDEAALKRAEARAVDDWPMHQARGFENLAASLTRPDHTEEKRDG